MLFLCWALPDVLIAWLLYIVSPPPLSGWTGCPCVVFCGLYVLSWRWSLLSMHFLPCIYQLYAVLWSCTPPPGCVVCLYVVT